MVIPPASIRLKVIRSSMSAWSSSVWSVMMTRNSCRSSGLWSSSSRVLVNPLREVRGVLSSWLTVATNLSLRALISRCRSRPGPELLALGATSPRCGS